jgi:hypothetical protein
MNRECDYPEETWLDSLKNNLGLRNINEFFHFIWIALHLVQGLGANFINWCENNSSFDADEGTVELYENPIVVNANMVAPNQNPNDGETQESDYAVSFERAAGSAEGQYCKTLVFMRPMVITYLRSGTRYYRWFYQNFEGNT